MGGNISLRIEPTSSTQKCDCVHNDQAPKYLQLFSLGNKAQGIAEQKYDLLVWISGSKRHPIYIITPSTEWCQLTLLASQPANQLNILS